MNAFELHAAAFAVMQQLTGNCPVFTWDGIDWLMIPNGAMLKKNLTVGGFSLDNDLKFFCLVDQFVNAGYSTADEVKDAMLETPMQYLADNYAIKSVTIMTGGLQLMITADALAQDA